MLGFVRNLALAGLLVLAACDRGDGDYTLYRDSTVAGEPMRIHVASFDAAEGDEYNAGNCEIARGLFQQQPGVAVKYWCERGAFEK